ncbi:MAG TPA: CvpA family protein [Bryobacteraceae bacterium]|jgi:membrane protein required for colicin V production
MQAIQSFNWFDILLIVIVAVSVVTGVRAGFARVAIGLGATVLGFMAGFWCYRLVAVKLQPWISSQGTAEIAGFFLIFIGVLILGSLLAAALSRLLRWVGLSWFNLLLGGVAGFFRGALMVAVLADVVVAFAPSPTPQYLQNSQVLPYANEVAAVLVELAPQQLKDSFLQQWENLRQFKASHGPHTRAI